MDVLYFFQDRSMNWKLTLGVDNLIYPARIGVAMNGGDAEEYVNSGLVFAVSIKRSLPW